MKLGNITFPDLLLNAIRDDSLVVFAGAGVSMGQPANLPSFPDLAKAIATGTGQIPQDREPEDRFLGRLQHNRVNVHALAAKELTKGNPAPTDLHKDLLRLFQAPEKVRLVTTNFDPLFQEAAIKLLGWQPDVFRAPALPLGRRFRGIVHVHGAVSHPGEMVLTDADFGRAYLTEGWARRYLIEAFRHFTVLFVGYSHNDLIVSYLARALPPSDAGHRFALTDEADDPTRWGILGITPITFPKPARGNFSSLYEGVRLLADTATRSLLDWQRELADLADKPPPISDEESDKIEYGLREAATTRFFTAKARLAKWLEWLDNRNHLDALFKTERLSDRDMQLATWLAEHFAVRCENDLFLLIAKHGMRINPQFWLLLGREISLGKQYPLSQQSLSRWISVLLATAPSDMDEHILLWLAERSIEFGIHSDLLKIFEVISDCNLILSRGFALPDEEEGDASRSKIDVDQPLKTDHFVINQIWGNGIKPNLEKLAEPVLSLALQRLEEQHAIQCVWQKADRDWDSTSYRRSAIEPHSQDPYPDAIDVLIDTARDSLQFLIGNNAAIAATWCQRLLDSDVPLWRRIAVYGVSVRPDLSADEKIELILALGLDDVMAHHEIYQAMRFAYPNASKTVRSRVIASILAFRWPNHEDPDQEKHTAHHHYDWLKWLNRVSPECDLVNTALKNIEATYPQFKPSEHPDFTHYMTSGWVGPQSPVTVDQLLAKPAEEWLPELIAFKSNDFFGPSRDGLVSAVAEAVKKTFNWGSNLATGLAKQGEWTSDLWDGLMRAWLALDVDEARYLEILGWISKKELAPHHPRQISELLNALVKNGGKPYAYQLLPQANEIASQVWASLERGEMPDESDDWMQKAISQPAGIIAEYWLGSLSMWRSKQTPRPDKLDTVYEEALTAMVKDQSLPGRLARAVFSGQLPFLLTADDSWTRLHVLPLLSNDALIQDYQAAWDGFLVFGHLNPLVADALKEAFLKAIPHLHDSLARRKHFVEHVTAFIAYFATDPLASWIPELFKHGGAEARHLFAFQLWHYLNGADEQQQLDWWHRWLKDYWDLRLQNVPVALDAREVERMLGWLPHLTAVFSDAVDRAIRMPKIPLEHASIFYDLDKSDLGQSYPSEVAQLLIYLGETGSPIYLFHDVPKIIAKINRTSLGNTINQKLDELALRLSIQ